MVYITQVRLFFFCEWNVFTIIIFPMKRFAKNSYRASVSKFILLLWCVSCECLIIQLTLYLKKHAWTFFLYLIFIKQQEILTVSGVFWLWLSLSPPILLFKVHWKLNSNLTDKMINCISFNPFLSVFYLYDDTRIDDSCFFYSKQYSFTFFLHLLIWPLHVDGWSEISVVW